MPLMSADKIMSIKKLLDDLYEDILPKLHIKITTKRYPPGVLEDIVNPYISQIYETMSPILSDDDVANLKERLSQLIGIQFDILRIPKDVLKAFEPSQIGTAVGTIMDATIPEIDKIIPNSTIISKIGLEKAAGILGEREGYPDYALKSGERLELKLLYVDPLDVEMKKPPTPREPSARITEKVTFKNIEPDKDALLVIAYQLQPLRQNPRIYCPTIINLGLFPIAKCILARDIRLISNGGRWFDNFQTPAVLSKIGQSKLLRKQELDFEKYGQKEEENRDYNKDTNFGKLARTPYGSLLDYIAENGASINSTPLV